MRGQAFEVFRLLIAAVIAGVILMTLLGIISTLVTPTQDPQQAAASFVKKFSKYGGKGVSDEITFNPKSTIYLPAVAAEAAISKDCIKGAVDSSLSGRFRVAGDSIEHTGNTNFRARIEVTCEQKTSGKCPVECTVKIVPR